MKKVFLLMGCLALLASCGKKAKEEAPKAETEVVVTEQPAVEAVVADPFPASESYPAKTDGFRAAEDGVITLYLVDAVNGSNKLEILADAMVVLADNSEVAISALDKTALNEKNASIWMKDGKVSRIKVNE